MPTRLPTHSTNPHQEEPSKPFQLPHVTRDPAAAFSLLTAYLSTTRQLPTSLFRAVVQQDPPAILAGWGPKYGHYLLFPCWDHSQPLKDNHPTGAILRWRHPDETPPLEWFGGNPRPMAPGSRKQDGWWQIGSATADTLIITEAPIDGLSVAASLPTFSDHTPALPSDIAILALGGKPDLPRGSWPAIRRFSVPLTMMGPGSGLPIRFRPPRNLARQWCGCNLRPAIRIGMRCGKTTRPWPGPPGRMP